MRHVSPPAPVDPSQNVDFVDQVLVTAGARGAVAKNQPALERAYELGKRLALKG